MTFAFRIGEVTQLAEAGATELQLQEFGYWRNAAYRRYLRPRTDAKIRMASLMAGGDPRPV